MGRRRQRPPATAPVRRLRGRRREAAEDRAEVALVRQTDRQRRSTAGSALARVRAIASDPHLHAAAATVTEANRRDYRIGGRPMRYPDWCLMLFGASIRIFGSASATARAFADPVVWNDAVRAAATILGQAQVADIPATGPNRDHWAYFLKRRVTPEVLVALVALQRDLAIRRAHEIGLLNATDLHSPGGYRRDHVVGIDGKVFNSPVRTLDQTRTNRATGEIRPVRQDPARQRYGEAGQEGIVWGTKFAIASVRSPLANHRVILGISHFHTDTKGGEGRVFVDLAHDLAARSAGIHAFTADGAWRGTHLNQIQTRTGCAVITPGRRLTSTRGGIVIDDHGHAAKPLPWSKRRQAREADCGGHQLWAAAGTLYEQTITADGGSTYTELTRHQTKRDTTRRKDGTVRHQFYARYTLRCPGHADHDWWEPLLPVTDDQTTKFNRCEYLRILPTSSPRHKQLYGMRQDTESLNAQLERAFYGQRLPAWGVHNQTTVVLLATLAENAWARHTWHAYTRRVDPPNASAA